MEHQKQFSVATSIFCRLMQLACLAAILFIGYLIFSIEISREAAWSAFGFLSQDQQNLVIASDFKTNLLKKVALAPQISALLILFGVFRVFGRFASRPFQLKKAGQVIRFLGTMIILAGLLDLATMPARSYIMTFDNPPGNRALDVTINPEHIVMFLLGIALFVAGNLTRSVAASSIAVGSEFDLLEAEEDLDEAYEELEESEAELDEAEEELAEAEAELASAETEEEIAEAIEEIAEAKEEIAEAQEEIVEAQQDIADAQATIEQAEAEIAEAEVLEVPAEPVKKDS